MGPRLATIIIEPRLLVREALESLMATHSYRVACGVGCTADIASPSALRDGPKLVILSVQSSDTAVTEALSARKLWPDSKIILLFENASPADLQKLLASQIDGCIPLFVSPDTMISTLDLIVTRDVRVMVLGDTKRPVGPPAQKEELLPPKREVDDTQSVGARHEPASVTMVAASDATVSNGGTQSVYPLRTVPKLSEREIQVLDGLIKGHANKVIARMCDITEATVKVHMKSILRKIQVGNRTQAAIWALEHGYLGDVIKNHALKAAASTHNATSIM